MAGSMPAALAAPPRDGRRLAAWLALGLVLPAWVLLAGWSASPWRGYVAHGGWGDAIALSPLCQSIPGGAVIVPAVLAALAWLLMIAAMMVPTVLPLVASFRHALSGRADSGRLVALLIAGYALAWLAFGFVAHAADAGVRAAAAASPRLAANAWLIGAAVLALAGAFQFSALKYRCLERCRTTFGFVNSHWHGRRPMAEAFRMGVDHGAFCVGCCWALMLVMFVVGMGNAGWMLALAGLMAVEKNIPGGHRVRTPVGLGLLAWSAAIVVAHA
ncbi:MAG: DUF2182 domain-containing protein [Betaproteobacteria bacterium]